MRPTPRSPASWTHTFSANRTISVPEDRKPTLIAGSSGDVLRVWNITGVAWNVNGTAVTLVPTDAFKDVPAGATGTNTVTATAATGYLLTGATLWTLTGVSSVTIAKEQVPTTSDQPGSKKDTVNIVAVAGVKWKVNGVDVTFPAGQSTTQVPTGGKDKVTVTAVSADTAKYRLAGTTAWTVDFKLGAQITIPASREPFVNDLSGTAQDTVTVYAVDKVTWTVDRTHRGRLRQGPEEQDHLHQRRRPGHRQGHARPQRDGWHLRGHRDRRHGQLDPAVLHGSPNHVRPPECGSHQRGGGH